MPEEIVTKGIPHKKLAPILERVRKDVIASDTFKEMAEKYDLYEEEYDLIPLAFAELPVSARTDHGCIYVNIELLENFLKDGKIDEDELKEIAHYVAHEKTHFGQQTTGNKPTPGSTDENYLDNPVEQEGFKNQTQYIAETQDEEAAEEYIEKVLDHHDEYHEDDKERESRKKKLIDLASEVRLQVFLKGF